MEDVRMSSNPFSIDVTVSGQGKKLFEQLEGLSTQEAQELLEGGYFTALREAKTAGRLPPPTPFRLFLSGDYKLVRTNLVLNCSKQFDPVAFLGEGWKELERDERAYNLTQVDYSKCQFLTCIKEGDGPIKGEEELRRLKGDYPQLIRHGGNQFLALWEDYQKNSADSVLEHLRLTQGITYLDFLGLVLLGPNNDRRVLYLCWVNDYWYWRCRWLGCSWCVRDCSVVSPASISA